MPIRRRRRVRNRRKPRVGRRRRKTGRFPIMNPMKSAFPANRVVKMKYLQNISLTPTAFIDSYFFRANSIHDPDATGAGHQPMGADQWSTFYKHYTVIGSRISVMNIAMATGGVPVIFGVTLSDLASTGHTTIEGLMESPKVNWKFQQTAVNGNVPKPAVMHFSAKKWFNLSQIKDNQDRVGGTFGSDPANQTYYHVFAGPTDGTSDLTVQRIVVKITYIVLLSHPRELSQS